MQQDLRVLFIEDSEADILQILRHLKPDFPTIEYRQVSDGLGLINALENEQWDIIITDYHLPGFSAEEALQIHRSLGSDVPVILVSGIVGEEIAVDMMKAGAYNYVLKDKLARIAPAIIRELHDFRLRQERQQIQNDLLQSQLRYQTLVKMSPDGICMLDPKFITILANPRTAAMFGYGSPEEMIGLNALNMISETYRQALLAKVPELLEQGSVNPTEVEFLRKDGSKFWGELRCSAILDNFGNLQSIVNVVTDISHRREMEAALVESESKFRSAFENAPIGMDILALNGRIMRANKAFCDLIGYDETELNTMTFYDLTHPDDLRDNQQLVDDMIANRIETVRFKKRYIRKDGEVIWVFVSSSLIRGQYNQPVYFVAQVQDITKQIRAEQEIILARDKAEESDRLKSALLANMSHELRTPMSGVLGFADIIAKTSEDPEIRDMAGLIQVSGKRLMTTLDSVMLLAQLESTDNIRDLNYTFVNLSRMMENLADKFRNKVMQKGLELKLEIEPDIYLSTEHHLLTQAINKVMDNALKFTEKGFISISLDLMVDSTESSVFIKVTDTGVGIEAGTKDRIFDEFRQASEGFARKYEGSGLGLPIARKIINLFRGSISVESDVGKGSIFTIKLPYQTEVTNITPAKPTIQSSAASAKKQRYLPLVLLVEDNPINQKLAVSFLTDVCQVDCVFDAKTAVEYAKITHYAAIMTDIKLGESMNGLDMVNLIRRLPGYANTPMIALTGYTLPGDKELIMKAGFGHYIGKPYTKEELVAVLEQAIKPEE